MNDPTNFVKPELISQHRSARAVNGFSEFDWWNFDNYLAWVIVGGLKMFREKGNGYPGDLTIEQWNALLDIMIEGFELHTTKFDWELGVNHEENSQKVDVALDIFRAYFHSLWD